MKTRYISILALILIAFTSCKDYLDVDSPSSFSTDYVFSNPEDCKKALLGAYQQFNYDPYTSRMSTVWMQNTDVEANQGPEIASSGHRSSIWSLEGKLLSGWSDILNAWNNNYLAIERCNQVIEGIQAYGNLDNADYKMMLGEAYALRATRYWYLCNFWGDVPYYSVAAKAGAQLDLPRMDKNMIYSMCIQDLVNCEEGMYWADEFSDGIERMNREYAIGLIARLSLFRAGYGMTKAGNIQRADEYLDVAGNDSLAVTYTVNGVAKTARTSQEYFELASDYCAKLISLKDRVLNPDFAQIFRNECEFVTPVNDDILYEVAFGANNSGGDVGWCIGQTVNASDKGSTTSQVGFAPTYYNSFNDYDLRRDITCSKEYYLDNTYTYLVQKITQCSATKWSRLWLTNSPGANSSKGTGANWPLMRYSDVLLMYAEAQNEINGGPTAEAKAALKRVRNRAFAEADRATYVETYVNNISSQDEFREAIINERAWEFGGECLRKFDLVRWGNYAEKIDEVIAETNNIGKAAYDIDTNLPEVAKYTQYADYLYYTKNSDGSIVFLNEKYKPDQEPTSEQLKTYEELVNNQLFGQAYIRQNWGRDLYGYDDIIIDEATGETERVYRPSNFVSWSYRGYTDLSGGAAVPYLLPIHIQTIANSEYLDNDGYLLN